MLNPKIVLYHIFFILILSSHNINCGILELLKCFKIVHQQEAIVLERFGQFLRVLNPGFCWKIPLIDAPRTITWSGIYENSQHEFVRYTSKSHRLDLRERVYNLPTQSVITKDNVAMKINALVYYEIEDPHKAVYGIDNLPLGIEKLAQTILRNIIGSISLDETLVSRDQINAKLCNNLDGATDKWGVKIKRVELGEVTPPHSILQAMEQQMTSERTRLAEITDADGKKKAAILKAEGDKSARILSAEGEAQSIRLVTEAQKNAVKELNQVLGTNPTSYMLASEYIKTLPKVTAGDKTKLVIVPYETTALAGMLSAMRQLVKE